MIYFYINDRFIHVMVFWHVFLFDVADASPVINLQCKGPNKTAAELILSWTKPNGQYISFLVTVKKDNKIINSASNILSLNHIVSNLSHYTDYNLTVETESCGQPSTPVSRRCQTGITSRTLRFVNIIIT